MILWLTNVYTYVELLDGYEWQGRRIEVREGRHPDRPSNSARPAKPLDSGLPPLSRPPPSTADSPYKPEPSVSAYQHHPSPVPPPSSIIPPPSASIPPPITIAAVPEAVDSYQNVYRYGGAEPVPPPPPPTYTHMTLVGGPAANLPTHGHNQIFVNNVI